MHPAAVGSRQAYRPMPSAARHPSSFFSSRSPATGLKKNLKDDVRLTALADMLVGNPQLRDAYSTLLAGLRLNPARDRSKSILVTSAQPNEGKTTIASHLAITASLAGQSVL